MIVCLENPSNKPEKKVLLHMKEFNMVAIYNTKTKSWRLEQNTLKIATKMIKYPEINVTKNM